RRNLQRQRQANEFAPTGIALILPACIADTSAPTNQQSGQHKAWPSRSPVGANSFASAQSIRRRMGCDKYRGLGCMPLKTNPNHMHSTSARTLATRLAQRVNRFVINPALVQPIDNLTTGHITIHSGPQQGTYALEVSFAYRHHQ